MSFKEELEKIWTDSAESTKTILGPDYPAAQEVFDMPSRARALGAVARYAASSTTGLVIGYPIAKAINIRGLGG